MKKLLMTGCAVLALSASAYAEQRTYTDKDLPVIVDVSENNELRFNREYKGQQFITTRHYDSIQGYAGTQHRVHFRSNHDQSTFGSILCIMTEGEQTLEQIYDWPKGRSAQVTGSIYTVFMGYLYLEHCTVEGSKL